MNNHNLIPTNQRPRREVSELGKKGGSVRSIGKKVAARVRELKKKGLTDDNAKHLLNILQDANYSSFDIMMTLEKTKSQCKTIGEINAVNRTILDWHKTHHGTKDKANINIQNNIVMINSDELDSTIMRFMNENK